MPTCTSHILLRKAVPCFDHRHMRARATGRGGVGSNSGVKARRACLQSLRAQRCAAQARSPQHPEFPNSSTAML
eukprot:5691741-Pleurochrysis_carterae.AAC.1